MTSKTRRNFLGVLTSGVVSSFVSPETSNSANVLARYALTGPLQGMEAVLVRVSIQPTRESLVHRHPGFVVGYVLEGELRFAIRGSSEQRIKRGETFFEPDGAVHTTSASAAPDVPVTFLAFLVVNEGSAITLPE